MQEQSRRKYIYLLANIIAFLFGNIGTKMISFFMVPLYTGILLPEEYGEIDLILSVAGVISPFIACGIHEGIMRFSLDKDADRSLVLSIGLRIFALTSIILLIVCLFLREMPILSNNTLFLYLYCVLNELMTIMMCYVRGCDNIKLYSLLGFFSAFFTALLNIFFLVVLSMGLSGYKLSMLLSPVFTLLMTFLMGRVKNDIHLGKWNTKLAREMLSYSIILIPNALLWWCINASDRFFVSFMCGSAANGIYAVSYKIPSLLSTVATIFMQAWQMSAIKEQEDKSNSRFSNEIYLILTAFMGLVTQIMLLFNRSFLQVYVGADYQSAWQYSGPLLVAFFVGALGTFWGSFYIAQKRMKEYLLSAVAGAVTNLVLNFCLIWWVGIMGAAVATLVSYIVVLWIRAVRIEKDVAVPFVNKPLISAFTCSVIAMLATYLPGLWSLVVGAITIVIYIIVNRQYVIFIYQRIIFGLHALKKD